jgi:hypothetical protein
LVFFIARHVKDNQQLDNFTPMRNLIKENLETNLYDVKTEKLIWSGQSETWSKDSKDQIINDVIKAVVNNLQKNKLLAPK